MGRKGLLSASRSQSVPEGSQGRAQDRNLKTGTRTETTKEHCLLTILFAISYSVYLLISLRSTCPRPSNDWQITSHENTLQPGLVFGNIFSIEVPSSQMKSWRVYVQLRKIGPGTAKTYPQVTLKEFWVPVIYLVSKTMCETPRARVFTKSYLATQRPPWKPYKHCRSSRCLPYPVGELETPEGLPYPGLPLWSPTQSTHAPFSWSTERGSTPKNLMKVPQILKVQIQSPESLTPQSGIPFPCCTKHWTTDI